MWPPPPALRLLLLLPLPLLGPATPAPTPAPGSPHVCGRSCCPGWSLAPGTHRCTRAACAPRCRPGGPCRPPRRCERPPPRPVASLRWQPLTPSELQAVLQRRVPPAPPRTREDQPPHPGVCPWRRAQSSAALGSARARALAADGLRARRSGSGCGMAGPGAARLVPAAALALLALVARLAAGQGGARLRVLFTPAVCQLRCAGHRCTTHCARGNATALYSGDPGAARQGFRVFLCPLICRNGGVCTKPDACLCPPGFTGKFCQLPANRTKHEAPPGPPPPPGHMEQGPQPLTKSVYTLPLRNHVEERDGAASLVNVHVEHPPEALVTIHEVARVLEPLPAPRGSARPPAPYRVLAQSSPRARGPGYGEDAGFGYCFRRLHDGECSSPVPGLRTREICCRGTGVAWGVHECQPCATELAPAPALGPQAAPCPPGFRRLNGSCVDVDECAEGEFCQNGVCTNTRGSFACLCHTGFLLDSARSSCISHQVISEAKGPCFRVLRDGACALPTLRNITKQICCCSRVGKAWGRRCERCPPAGSEGFKEICPAGPGYHYSASDLRYDTRYLGHDLPRVPVGRPPHPRLPSPTTPRPVPGRTPPPTARPEPEPQTPAVPTAPPAPAPGGSVCERNPQICGPGRCVPRQGGYTCLCHPGYWLSTQGTHCIDVDECRRSPRPCAHGRCENTVGGFRCACDPGYRADPAGTRCLDVDECAQSPRPCTHGRCENTPGSYRCACPAGYRANAAGTSCSDIDECARSPRPCAPGRCENAAGSYRCACPAGYQPGPGATECLDVDECADGPCEPGRCQNLPGGYRCTCPSGFQPGPGATGCTDVDECRDARPPCGAGSCENLPGAYRCLCPEGYHAGARQAECQDVDECATGTPCGLHGRCTNTAGSFRCECRPGYRAQAPGGPCMDVNECLEGDFCFPHGECLNADGSYTCLCAQGFAAAPDGASCLDVDECRRGGACEGGRCVNTEGSFDCYCPAGFRTGPDKTDCQDVDECQDYRDALCGAQRCENLPGSYRCVADCDPGYQAGSNGQCHDVDECETYGAHLCGAQRCQNLPGSYRCVAPCDPGYEPGPGSQCHDVDECANGTRCGVHAVCHNLPGAFQCVCDQGYETARDGHHCQDVNECETLQGVCGAELCENVEGSFLCLCPSSDQEFDPMTGRCTRPPGAALPSRPEPPELRVEPEPELEPVLVPGEGARRECYRQGCGGLLAWNTTRQECCCTLGGGWGPECSTRPCPTRGSAQYQALCPGIGGIVASGPHGALADVDECVLFGPHACMGGVCVNKVPGYACYCPSGYYYEREQLECVDNDECQDEEAEACVGGRCVNTVGSYYCSCQAPLVLDASQRRCVANDSQALDANQAVCWQEVGPDLVCGRPRLDRQVTYTECCCVYGEAWGMDCALCPDRDSDDFELLCNVLRPPSYGAARPGLGLPYEYSPELAPGYGLPYGPDFFPGSPARGPPRPDYDPYPLGSYGGPRDALYGPPPYEAPDFEDLAYVDARPAEPPFPRPRGPPWRYPARDAGERPGRASESDGLEPLQEECGVLSGCENGRCVRVPEGYTCDCHPGYRLDAARMACLDVDECSEATPPPCPLGRCLNTDGSYRCLCPRGHVPAGPGQPCLPAPAPGTGTGRA